MKTVLVVPLLLASAPTFALAHGGGFATPPGPGGPTAAPGLGDPAVDPKDRMSGPQTRWETWWSENREDLLKIAEHVDADKPVVVTPSARVHPGPPDAADKRFALAAKARVTIVPVLLRALEDGSDFDVRASAAVALGKTGDPAASAPLREAARHDKRPDVRRSAILGLGLLGRAEDLVFLCDFAGDRARDADERAMALLGIGLSGGDDAAAWLSYFVDKALARPEPMKSAEAQIVATAIAALGVTGSPDAVATLAKALDDPNLDEFFRAHAALSLGRLKDRGSIDRLVRLLRRKEVQLRRSGAAALGRVVQGGDVGPTGMMLAAVEEERDPAARRFLIESLGVVRAPAVSRSLRQLVDDGPAADRPFVVLALGLQRDATAAPLVRKHLERASDESVKSACCMALGLLADADSIPVLESELGHGSSPGTYRGYAALALGVIPSLGSRDVIWKRLRDEADPRVRGDYAVALGLLGDRRVRAYLLDELKGSGGNFAKCTAAMCLGTLRDSDVVPDLVAIVENERADGIVRALCVVALGQIADSSLVPKLSRLPAGGDSSLSTKALSEALTIL